MNLKQNKEMKKILTIAVLLLIFICADAQNGKNLYKKYSDAEGVSAVYISPAMFRMMGKLPDLNVEGQSVNLAPIIKTMSGLYLINSENPEINVGLAKEVEKFISKGDYELLMETKDAGETVRMYTVGTETVVESFVMIAYEENQTTFICLDGKMNREELEAILAERMQE